MSFGVLNDGTRAEQEDDEGGDFGIITSLLYLGFSLSNTIFTLLSHTLPNYQYSPSQYFFYTLELKGKLYLLIYLNVKQITN